MTITPDERLAVLEKEVARLESHLAGIAQFILMGVSDENARNACAEVLSCHERAEDQEAVKLLLSARSV